MSNKSDVVKINARVCYRAFDGVSLYDAVITDVGPPGFASLAVTIPGVAEPWSLRAVRIERIEPARL
jgi:hypothetical protein